MAKKIPKPEGCFWTDEQWDAISIRDENILVAAGAGSGKTAVLVERLIRRILSSESPQDVDRFLVATFTQAAAAEMRHRIREALEKELFQNPRSHHLLRQIALIQRANITTLHSFCLDVIRRYYSLIHLDPSFRVAQETEAELLKQETLEEMLEEYYGSQPSESEFWQLADWFSGDRSDEALIRLVLKLYDFSRSHPWPRYWLEEMAKAFDIPDPRSLEQSPWVHGLKEEVCRELRGIRGQLEEAKELCALPGGPAPYLEQVENELVQVEHLLSLAEKYPWEYLYNGFQAFSFGKLKPCRKDETDPLLQERVRDIRNEAKESVSRLKTELFQRSLEDYARELNSVSAPMRMLVRLVNDFADRYQKAKQAKGLLDFSDLEHYCLDILRHPDSTPDRMIPSQAALDYREQFEEILLDEYQDTNRVQEAIIALISREEPGNRFMVGDVKQSIYRFRLAEPKLFLNLYKSFRPDGGKPGRRIDLASNFRSRREVVDGVNFIFRQIMNEAVGEIQYDERAELKYAASYPGFPEGVNPKRPVELVLFDGNVAREEVIQSFPDEGESEGQGANEPEEEWPQGAEREGRWIAHEIRRLMEGQEHFLVFDRDQKQYRPLKYRDIVILLRSTKEWAPIILAELKEAGIPAYAELNSGYFEATEVEVVLSALKTIDNPYQDIALAALLRSPMFLLNAEQLAKIRISGPGIPFYDAILNYVRLENAPDKELQHVLRRFLKQLGTWRDMARQVSLADLIWRIYRDTGFYDFVGGMPGGPERQANLRALYDRARMYESTSFKGLFRFLRFIERMRERGQDMGTARSLGEQEDVVRIMSIHQSKGLEFPVVFVAGLGKKFNLKDLNERFLMHRELGFGPKYFDSKYRISYPALPRLAIQRRIRMEMQAEEMRILYVALTRAKEKLYLLGTPGNIQGQLSLWGQSLLSKERVLPDSVLARANSFLDWIGPAVLRHPMAAPLRQYARLPERAPDLFRDDPSLWKFTVVPPEAMKGTVFSPGRAAGGMLQRLLRLESFREAEVEGDQSEIGKRLSWTYPYPGAPYYLTKISVSEMRRLNGEEQGVYGRFDPSGEWEALFRRPAMVQKRRLTPMEKGTAYHLVMQHIPLQGPLTLGDIQKTMESMVERQLLTKEQYDAVDAQKVMAFFASELGRRILRASEVRREVPFSYGIPVKEVYPDADPSVSDETILVQGVIDCLFEEDGCWILVDYKTDQLAGRKWEDVAEKYRPQLALYARAVSHILRSPVKEKYLYFLEGGILARL